jgi:3-oxoacyl-[acyl-carrier-protein] synthase II
LNALINGVSGAAPITYFDPKFRTHFACELKNFNAEDFLDRKEARKWTAMRNMPWLL